MISKDKKISLLSLFSAIFKICGGPLTLIFISQYLSDSELALYYAFFSVLALKSLLEAGVGNVLRRYYAFSNQDKEKSSVFKFSIYWYGFISIQFFILTYLGGNWYFSSYQGNIDWEIPWLLTVFIMSLRILLLILDSFVDGNQNQIDYRIVTLISLIVTTISLIVSLYFGFALYSIFISQCIAFLSAIIYYFFRRKFLFYIQWDFSDFKFFNIFMELWPLLSKTFIVWFVGYFFWNGFNLIAFKILDVKYAGMVGFSLALSKAGYDVAYSLFINQGTLISYYLSKNRSSDALSLFYKYSFLSFSTLVCGYILFLFFKNKEFDFSLFSKTIESKQLIWLFLFYILVLIKSLIHNFVRCFNVEPFVWHVTYNAIVIPISFYLSIKYTELPWFFIPFLLMIPMLLHSYYVLRLKVLSLNENIN